MVSRNGPVSDLRGFSLIGGSRWASLKLHNSIVNFSQVDGSLWSTEMPGTLRGHSEGFDLVGGGLRGSSLEPCQCEECNIRY